MLCKPGYCSNSLWLSNLELSMKTLVASTMGTLKMILASYRTDSVICLVHTSAILNKYLVGTQFMNSASHFFKRLRKTYRKQPTAGQPTNIKIDAAETEAARQRIADKLAKLRKGDYK